MDKQGGSDYSALPRASGYIITCPEVRSFTFIRPKSPTFPVDTCQTLDSMMQAMLCNSHSRCLRTLLILTTLLIHASTAHLIMKWPYAFGSKHLPGLTWEGIDYNLKSPLDMSGRQFPCKGYHISPTHGSNLPVDQTHYWEVNTIRAIVLEGTAWHDGGSCQISLSYDRGATWRVIKSFIGGCPRGPPGDPNQNPKDTALDFVVPVNAPLGQALVAWTWFNRVGLREMYMNCAKLQILPAGSFSRLWQHNTSPAGTTGMSYNPNYIPFAYYDYQQRARRRNPWGFQKVNWSQAPLLLVMQQPCLSNCRLDQEASVIFPEPGMSFVTNTTSGPLRPPSGTCTYPTQVPCP